MRQRSIPDGSNSSFVTVFWGTGASGATTYSLEYANQLAKHHKTLLIDCDLTDPSLMVYLAIDDYPSGLQAGVRLAGQQRLDGGSLQELLVTSDFLGGLNLIAGLPAPGRYRSLEPTSVSAMIESLRTWFDEIVIDMGSVVPATVSEDLSKLHKEIFASADDIYGVFRADPEGLAKLFWIEIEGELIANNYRPGCLGPGGKKGLKSVIADSTGKIVEKIAEEDEFLVKALSKAIPVGMVSRKSPVSQLVKALIENRLLGAG